MTAEATNRCIAELDYAFEKELGDCSISMSSPASERSGLIAREARSVAMLPLCSALAHRLASRVIVPQKLARDETFVKAILSYNQSIFLCGLAILKLPLGPFRDLLSVPISYLTRRKQAKVIGMISPFVEERMRRRELGIIDTDEPDLIDATLNLLGEFPINADGSPPLWRISHELMHNMLASGSNPGSVVAQMTFQILHEPRYLEALRTEAEDALEKYGWTEKLVNALVLQDSFIREVGRLYPTFSSK